MCASRMRTVQCRAPCRVHYECNLRECDVQGRWHATYNVQRTAAACNQQPARLCVARAPPVASLRIESCCVGLHTRAHAHGARGVLASNRSPEGIEGPLVTREYCCGAFRYQQCPLSSAEKGLLTLIEDYWTSFAVTGWPASGSAAAAWAPLQEGAALRATMQLDLPSGPVTVDPMDALCKFWQSV